MAVMKANKFTETNPQEYHQTSLRPFGVTVYHSLRQPYGMPQNNGNPAQFGLGRKIFSMLWKLGGVFEYEVILEKDLY